MKKAGIWLVKKKDYRNHHQKAICTKEQIPIELLNYSRTDYQN